MPSGISTIEARVAAAEDAPAELVLAPQSRFAFSNSALVATDRSLSISAICSGP